MRGRGGRGRGGDDRPTYVPSAQKTTGGRGTPVTDSYGQTNQAKIPDHPFVGAIGGLEEELVLLNDDQMKSFLFNGFLILKTGLPHTFHQYVYSHMESHPVDSNVGNNILPTLPCLNQVYEDPSIKGALVSLLGKNYIMQPHRFCHLTPPGKSSQKWHRDTFWGYGRNLRYNKIRYVMAMYYPQKTTLEMGPTGVKPGTQYYSIDPKFYKGDLPNHFSQDSEGQDKFGVVEAGSVLFIHYDVIHKGSANTSQKNRYMFKFQFSRMEEPVAPTWNISSLNWNAGEFSQGKWKSLEPICRSIWEWLCGGNITPLNLSKNEMQSIVPLLDDKLEWNRFYANFSLALSGQANILLSRLKTASDQQFKINATYALACAQPTEGIITSLMAMLKLKNSELTQMSIYILGQYGRHAAASLKALCDFLDDPNANIRATTCEAIGIIGSSLPTVPQEIVSALATNLQDTEGKVRFQCAEALAQLGPSAECVLPELVRALSDCNRYVQGFSMIALKRMNTPKALDILFNFLMASRWCPLTTPNAPF